jgi:peptidoglycan hydrolase-like protein with peptidoglycan-binding domain
MYIARYSLDSNISSGGYQTDVSVYPTNTIAQKELNTYLNSTSNPFSNLTMSNGQTIYYNSGSSYHGLYYYMYSWISGNSLIVITKSTGSNENGVSNDSLVLSYLNKYPTNLIIDTGCTNNQIYSSTTGQKCTASITPTNTARRTLRWGLSGDDVKALQKNLGLNNTDGIYGSWTMAKVKEWQVKNGLNADGVFGPGSQSKMGL